MSTFRATLTRYRLAQKPVVERVAEALMDDEEYEEYQIAVDVEYEVNGQYERDEFPDVEIVRVTDRETNEEITLTKAEEVILGQDVGLFAADECREREISAAELRADAMKEEGWG